MAVKRGVKVAGNEVRIIIREKKSQSTPGQTNTR